MKNISKKKLFLLLIIPALILLDIIACVILYFVEPVYYAEPDLLQTAYTFELYYKFSYDKNPDFYIKQISADDIESYENDFRLKYLDNTIIIICDETTTTSDVTSLVSDRNGKICGYISYLNLYQIEFENYNYEELVNICSEYSKNEFVWATCVDYFEETPIADDESSNYISFDEIDYTYKSIINYPDNFECNSDVVVGIFDCLVDKNNEYFNIVNSEKYDNDWLKAPQYINDISHGSHVAGIACCSADSDSPAVYPAGSIVSDNAFNNTISYWIASITDMIVNYNVKTVNISMGYNSFVSLSANLGCKNAISYIENESFFFEKFLEKLIDADYEFLLCLAAGNESGSTINKIPSHFFSYGDKKILNKFDIFNLFTRKLKYADAKFSLPFTYIENEKVKEHIIIVGSCDNKKAFSKFSDAGNSVDIIATGEDIYSFILDGEYDYWSGTSMATPFVTGAAALIFSYDNSLSAGEVKNILINSATETVSGYGFKYPLLNVAEAVSVANNF